MSKPTLCLDFDGATGDYPQGMSEEERQARFDLRRYWSRFCDADVIEIDRDDFTDRLEKFGLVEWREVTQRDADSTPFAYESGLEVGGMCWDLTDKGRKVLTKPV